VNTPITPRPRSRRRRGWPSPPNRTDSLQPPNFQPIHVTAAHVAEHRTQHPPKGLRTMLDRSQLDATVFRVAVAAFTYYPDKPHREPGYTLDEDLDWCMRPLRPLSESVQLELRQHISALVTDPAADRQAFIRKLHRYTEEFR
jgi:hypothetical protein